MGAGEGGLYVFKDAPTAPTQFPNIARDGTLARNATNLYLHAIAAPTCERVLFVAESVLSSLIIR